MTVRFRLLVKKRVYVPTLWDWFVLFACAAVLSLLAVRGAYPFLAYENPKKADVFIIEGWVPDHVLKDSLPQFEGSHPPLFITTGGPIELGQELSKYKNYAELAAARLVKMGFDSDRIVALPNQPVDRDRTCAAALEVRGWLRTNPEVKRANLITKGPHARRSFIIFKKVLPSTFELGVYAVPPQDYDPRRWWAYSEGFRTVVSEGIAYTYVRLIGAR